MVTDNEFVLTFNFSGRKKRTTSHEIDASEGGGGLFRRNLQYPPGDLRRQLQGNCLGQAELKFAETMLEDHANSVYDNALQGSVSVSKIEITVTDHIDMSDAGDCSKIKFIYDQEMVFRTTGTNDTPTLAEIIQMPMADESSRSSFVSNLVEKSAEVAGDDGGSSLLVAWWLDGLMA